MKGVWWLLTNMVYFLTALIIYMAKYVPTPEHLNEEE